MIEQIQIKNFKSIRDTKLDLGPINVLVGPNGAGKSNFVNFFTFLQAIFESRLGNYVAEQGGTNKLLYLGTKHSHQLLGYIKFSDKTIYSFDLRNTVSDNLFFNSERFARLSDSMTEDTSLEVNNKVETSLDEYEYTSRANYSNFTSFHQYHFHDTSPTAPLKYRSRAADTRFLRTDGSNLAAFLYDLQQNHSQSFNRIEVTVRLIAPFFDHFDLQPTKNGEYIRLNWRQKGTDMYLDASDLSDGTLRFIALATLLLQPDPPATILIDEPELGLHPYAITVLAGLVQSISSKTQIILSTQSVNLVNEFEPNNIIVVENRQNESIFKRLDAADLIDWLEEYTLGDLWNKNVFGGNP